MSIYVRDVHPLISGKFPENSLSLISTIDNFSWCDSCVAGPENKFPRKFKIRNEETVESQVVSPVSAFSLRSINSGSECNSGTSPVSWFCVKLIVLRKRKFPREDGMTPVRSLRLRSRYDRYVRFPICCGIYSSISFTLYMQKIHRNFRKSSEYNTHIAGEKIPGKI